MAIFCHCPPLSSSPNLWVLPSVVCIPDCKETRISLPVASCSPLTHSNELRHRNAEKLSPKRAGMTIVNSDSLPAVAEEPLIESDDVFVLADESSVNGSLENVDEEERCASHGKLTVLLSSVRNRLIQCA